MPPASQAVPTGLTDEQLMLVGACARIVDALAVRSPAPGEPVAGDPAAWRAVLDVGLPTLGLDAGRGGGGASLLDLAVAVERLARGPLAAPVVGTALAAALLTAAAGPPAVATAGPLAAGTASAARALDELVGGRPGAVALRPGLDALAGTGDAWAFDWTEGALVVGIVDDQVVATTMAGGRHGADLTRRLATGSGAWRPMGTIGADARRLVEAQALVLLCADLVGAMDAALDLAVAHAVERHQFGRPIGSFQAVQQLCADQAVTVSAARAITRAAAEAVGAGSPDDALHQARVAKAYCAEHAPAVCEAAVQVWGGLGMTWECPAHLFLRRALLTRRVLGDEHTQYDALVDEHLFAASAPAA
jgi:alkylation response protein AidB-like acyl-CoA dehydrogenase